MAVNYACYIFNYMSNEKGIAPIDFFTGMQAPRYKLFDIHIWRCPVYVLYPKLQEGNKLPRWQPRSKRGVCVGSSNHNFSNVPFILNLQTNHISPQFYIMFDNNFLIVNYIFENEDPLYFWNELQLYEYTTYIPNKYNGSQTFSK